MQRFLAVILLCLTSFPALAGCWSAEASPSTPPIKATICFKGECSETTLDYECGNVFKYVSGYANGWSFVIPAEGKGTITTPSGEKMVNVGDVTIHDRDGETSF